MAIVTAFVPLNIDQWDLGPVRTGMAVLADNIQIVSDAGIRYEDVVLVVYNREQSLAAWTGSGLAVDTAGQMTAGTVRGLFFGNADDLSDTWMFDNVAPISATALQAAIASTSRADDLALLQQALANADRVTLSPGADLFRAYGGNDTLLGMNGADRLEGGEGNDSLDGGTGADTLLGGSGNDAYRVDSLLDRAVETTAVGGTVNAGGVDTVFTTVNWTLGAYVENLTVSGTDRIDGTGNALANLMTGGSGVNALSGGSGNDTLQGGAGNDTLDGGTGVDRLVGGTGNDTYVVDAATDVIAEVSTLFDEIDTVRSSVSYTLGANLDALVLTGSAAIQGTGNARANAITGNAAANLLAGGTGGDTLNGGAGNDTLDGGTGANRLYGGSGNDTYVIRSTADLTFETGTLASEVDTVLSSVSWTLLANVERLTLTDTALRGTGNALANRITGNASNNTLDGAAGNDTLTGGLGNDTYFVNAVGDVIVETSTLAGEIDTVRSAVNRNLGANLENLALLGTVATRGTGNVLANVITGNDLANVLGGGAGNDRLDGGFGDDTLTGDSGNDTLIGGIGNDTFVIDSAGDVTTETVTSATQIDTVRAPLAWTLGANIENLVLVGTAAVAGTGNGLANALTGNTGANLLAGLGGDDTLVGGGGNDTLAGGAGNDSLVGGSGTVVFRLDTPPDAATNVDRIDGFQTGEDRIELDLVAFGALGAPGALVAEAFVVGTVAGDADDRIVHDPATGQLFYDADGTGEGAAVLFAILPAGATLVAGDFWVV